MVLTPNCYPEDPYDPWRYNQDACYSDWYSQGCPGYQGDDDAPYEEWQPGDPGQPCYTGLLSVDDSMVGHGFAVLWGLSNPDAPALGDRHERGGWIVKTATGYRMDVWPNVGTSCGMNGGVPAPPEGLSAIVGFVHTHPYFVGQVIVSCDTDPNVVTGAGPYDGTASNYDRATSVALGSSLPWSGGPAPLPGVILDKEKVRTFVGSSTASDATYDRCGF